MPTQTEEQQAKEFLKRAEIRTMRKDLLKLREADSLKERDKIATIKTLEEQMADKKKADQAAEAARALKEKTGREEVLQKNENQEYNAEKDLKNYATEEERQEIFLLESQRVGFEKQVDIIDRQKDPALKLQKNQSLLQVQEWQTKLNAIIEQEKKLEDEQKLIAEKSQTTTFPAERKSLEQRRWDIDKMIQDIEKKRWAVEKAIQDLNTKVKQVDQQSQQLVEEKNSLRDKILGIDKQLREIYSGVIARVEERRRGEAEDQKEKREMLEKIRAEKNENVQRGQWHGTAVAQPEKAFLKNAQGSLKEKLAKTAAAEEEQRKKFLQDVSAGDNKPK